MTIRTLRHFHAPLEMLRGRASTVVNKRRLALVGVAAATAALVLLATLWTGTGSGAKVAASGSGQATLNGVTVKVLGIESTAAATTVTISVSGRDDLGEVLESFTRPVLIDAAGTRHQAIRGSRDADLPRQYVLVFDAVSADSSATLVIGDLSFETRAEHLARSERAQAGAPQNGLKPGRTVPGTWFLGVTMSRSGGAREAMIAGAVVAFGPGLVTVERAVVTEAEILLSGRIDGFLPDQFQVLQIAPAALTVDGVEARFLGGRSGFGPGNASFELRFARVDGSTAQLSVPFNVAGVNTPGGTHVPEASAALARFAGTRAAVTVTLPR